MKRRNLLGSAAAFGVVGVERADAASNVAASDSFVDTSVRLERHLIEKDRRGIPVSGSFVLEDNGAYFFPSDEGVSIGTARDGYRWVWAEWCSHEYIFLQRQMAKERWRSKPCDMLTEWDRERKYPFNLPYRQYQGAEVVEREFTDIEKIVLRWEDKYQ